MSLVILAGFHRPAGHLAAGDDDRRDPAGQHLDLVDATGPVGLDPAPRRRAQLHLARQEAGSPHDPGSARWRAAMEPGANPATVKRLAERPPRPAAAPASVSLDPLATLNRPSAIDVRAPASPIPAVAGGRSTAARAGRARAGRCAVAAGECRRDSRARTGATGPEAGLGPALPGLPRSARSLNLTPSETRR